VASRLLLDTHVLLWWLGDDSRLRADAAAAIADPATAVYVSAASAWEIAIKKTVGRLEAPDDLPAQLEHHGFAELPVSVAHALGVEVLPVYHPDPFDRLLVAQAMLEGLTIVTSDAQVRRYGVPTLAA
jgi:PIN domain nuclease of toxin-antitoxin system